MATIEMDQASRLMKAIRRHLKDACSPRMAEVFFEIAAQSAVSYEDLMKRTLTPHASLSWLVTALGEGWPAENNPGLRLVKSSDDPCDNWNKNAQLTAEGRRALASILSEIN
jgi:hypothetical protein